MRPDPEGQALFYNAPVSPEAFVQASKDRWAQEALFSNKWE